MSTKGLAPFNFYLSDGSVTGVDVDLMDILAEKFNFTYQIKVEKLMGRPVNKDEFDGPWLGVVGSVRNTFPD